MKITVERCDKILVTVLQIFDRVKSVALWSANIRKLAKDHKGYGSTANLITEIFLTLALNTNIPNFNKFRNNLVFFSRCLYNASLLPRLVFCCTKYLKNEQLEIPINLMLRLVLGSQQFLKQFCNCVKEQKVGYYGTNLHQNLKKIR